MAATDETAAARAAPPPAAPGNVSDVPEPINWTLTTAAAVALLVSGIFSPDRLPELGLCFFRRSTGLPCPGCGLTHAFCAITHGEFQRAWHENPFSYVFYAGTLAILLRPAVLRAWPAYTRWENRILATRWALFAPLGLIIAMVIFGLARVICLLASGQGA